MIRKLILVVSVLLCGMALALPTQALEIAKDKLIEQLTVEDITIPFPADFERWPEPVVYATTTGLRGCVSSNA